jgi:DNA-damage-inducible protein J
MGSEMEVSMMSEVSTNISLDLELKKVSREEPNGETAAAMNEYYAMKEHPERYKRYSSFKDALNSDLFD